jgi:hypothetical protein
MMKTTFFRLHSVTNLIMLTITASARSSPHVAGPTWRQTRNLRMTLCDEGSPKHVLLSLRTTKRLMILLKRLLVALRTLTAQTALKLSHITTSAVLLMLPSKLNGRRHHNQKHPRTRSFQTSMLLYSWYLPMYQHISRALLPCQSLNITTQTHANSRHHHERQRLSSNRSLYEKNRPSSRSQRYRWDYHLKRHIVVLLRAPKLQ